MAKSHLTVCGLHGYTVFVCVCVGRGGRGDEMAVLGFGEENAQKYPKSLFLAYDHLHLFQVVLGKFVLLSLVYYKKIISTHSRAVEAFKYLTLHRRTLPTKQQIFW